MFYVFIFSVSIIYKIKYFITYHCMNLNWFIFVIFFYKYTYTMLKYQNIIIIYYLKNKGHFFTNSGHFFHYFENNMLVAALLMRFLLTRNSIPWFHVKMSSNIFLLNQLRLRWWQYRKHAVFSLLMKWTVFYLCALSYRLRRKTITYETLKVFSKSIVKCWWIHK